MACTHIAKAEVVQKHVLLVAQRHVQHVHAAGPLPADSCSSSLCQHVVSHGNRDVMRRSRRRAIQRQAVVQFAQLLLLDAHAVEEAAASAVVGRVAFFLEDHLLRQVGHDRLRGQPREAGDGRQVAEHQHAGRREVGVHGAVAAQELVAQLVLDEAHGGRVGAGGGDGRRGGAVVVAVAGVLQ